MRLLWLSKNIVEEEYIYRKKKKIYNEHEEFIDLGKVDPIGSQQTFRDIAEIWAKSQERKTLCLTIIIVLLMAQTPWVT